MLYLKEKQQHFFIFDLCLAPETWPWKWRHSVQMEIGRGDGEGGDGAERPLQLVSLGKNLCIM